MPSRPIVLASASPRRKHLLREIFPEFEVLATDLDEEALTLADPWDTAKALSRAKAHAALALRPDALVIGGDTVVAIPDGGEYRQLAKPTSPLHAQEMLRSLSGRDHIVVTGICVVQRGHEVVDSDTTTVRFRQLADREIAAYVETGEPMDKAGAYAIQGGASGFVESVQGSVSNVVGLPLELLRLCLGRLA